MKPTPTWNDLTSFANLLAAYQKAARGKRARPVVAVFEFELENNLIILQKELLNGSYSPGGYASFTVHAPKRRLISAAPFRDRMVHFIYFSEG